MDFPGAGLNQARQPYGGNTGLRFSVPEFPFLGDEGAAEFLSPWEKVRAFA